jgi:hypothetical protein
MGAPADDKVPSLIKKKQIRPQPQVERTGNVFQHAPHEKSVEKKEVNQPEIGKTLSADRTPSNEVSLQKTPEDVEKGNVSTPAPPSSAPAMFHSAPLENEAPLLPVKKLDGASIKSDPFIPVPQKTTPAETGARGADDLKQGQGLRVLAGVVVKLLTVAFSCLALILAYRAWLMTGARNKG